MPDLCAGLGRRGARRDRPFAGQPPPAVVAAVAFAALLPGAAQVRVQRPAGGFVRPEVAIDRFVADRELVVCSQPASNLLGAPILPHERLHPRPVRGYEPPIAPRPRAASLRVPIGELGAVAPVPGRAVAPDLAADRAAVAPEHPGDRGGAQAASPQYAQRISFRAGDLVIHHRYASFSWPRLKITVSQVTFFFRARCCTYYMNPRRLTSA